MNINYCKIREKIVCAYLEIILFIYFYDKDIPSLTGWMKGKLKTPNTINKSHTFASAIRKALCSLS